MSGNYYRAYNGYDGIYYDSFQVMKHTPKGVWIFDWYSGKKKFVLEGIGKRYACPTKLEAARSIVKRTEKHLVILQSRIGKAFKTLELAKKEVHKLENPLMITCRNENPS